MTKKQELILSRANIVIVTTDQKMKVELARFFKTLKWNSVKYVNSPQDFYNLKSDKLHYDKGGLRSKKNVA